MKYEAPVAVVVDFENDYVAAAGAGSITSWLTRRNRVFPVTVPPLTVYSVRSPGQFTYTLYWKGGLPHEIRSA